MQQTLVAAFAAAGAADPALAAEVAELAAQAGEQLERLQAAAPGSTASRPRRPPTRRPPAPEAGPGCARRWPRRRPRTPPRAWTSPAARAALLGSIAAGLRGQDGTTGMTGVRPMADDERRRGASTRAPRTPRSGEALAAEHAAVWGYGVVGAALRRDRPRPRPARRGGPPRRAGPGARAARRPGGRAVPAEGGYALPFPVLSPVDAAALAVVLEDGVAAAWVRVLDQSAERSTRESR